METEDTGFDCSRCEKRIFRTPGPGGTGYGENDEGDKFCYACCGLRDKERMAANGKITLYLTDEDKIQNWCGSLTFIADRVRAGRHNIAKTRFDAWFTDSEGRRWWGVSYGDFTQLIHCRRIH